LDKKTPRHGLKENGAVYVRKEKIGLPSGRIRPFFGKSENHGRYRNHPGILWASNKKSGRGYDAFRMRNTGVTRTEMAANPGSQRLMACKVNK